MTGGPGMGKSALLTAWLARLEAAGTVVPHHFIRRREYDWDDPAKLVASLVAQTVVRFPDLPEPEPDERMHPAARLFATLRRVSQVALVPRGERLVLLIDGLDEYDPPTGIAAPDPLAAFLPHSLPAGVSVLCASRPRHPYVAMLATRGAVQLDLDAEDQAEDNAATVRAFWKVAAPALGLEETFIDKAVARADGNMQHAAMLRKHLANVPPRMRRVEDIPRGLGALLASAWNRVASEEAAVVGLGILCAAHEALTLDELGAVAGWAGEAPRRAFMRGARELLLERDRTEEVFEYRLHHDSIRAQVSRAVGKDALATYHGALANKLATWPLPRDTTARRYALRYALIHRVEAGVWLDAWRIAPDLGFLQAKCRELGVHETEADLARIAERCRASGDAALVGRFADLTRAFARESHWLRVAPEATAALVWNRLQQLGWSAGELDEHMQVPAGSRFLRVRHLATRESAALLRDLIGHAKGVHACAVTPDGRRAVSASGDKTLKVWDLASGRVEATLEGHVGGVIACALTPDGRRVVSGSWDKTLKVWDLASGRAEATMKGHADWVLACAVTPDGRRVVSASRDKTLKVWDLESGRAEATLEGHADKVSACAVTPDGRRVVSASWDNTLKVWDLASGRAQATLKGHASEVYAYAVTLDGRRVVSEDETLKGVGSADWVNACTVTPDGRRVVSASENGTLTVWDLASGRAEATLEGHTFPVTACAVTPDGRRAVSASSDRTLKVWDLASGRAEATLEGHTSGVAACVVTPDGQKVVSGSVDKTLKVWDLASGRTQATVKGHAFSVNACAVTPDGRRMVSASDDKSLKVWELASGRVEATLQGHYSGVLACAVTPDGRRVVSGSWDKMLKVWDLASGRTEASLEGHAFSVNACAVTPDGWRVVSGSSDRTLKVWDLASGRAEATLQGHADGVRACAVTPDGRRVVSASGDRTLKVWDLASGRAEATLQGHADSVNACAVTPDGRRMVSASGDRTLKVWDLASGRAEATLQGHADSVKACAVTPDGRRVISGSADGTLKVWDLRTSNCLLTHRANVGYVAITCTAMAIVAGDVAGAVWFLDWPP